MTSAQIICGVSKRNTMLGLVIFALSACGKTVTKSSFSVPQAGESGVLFPSYLTAKQEINASPILFLSFKKSETTNRPESLTLHPQNSNFKTNSPTYIIDVQSLSLTESAGAKCPTPLESKLRFDLENFDLLQVCDDSSISKLLAAELISLNYPDGSSRMLTGVHARMVVIDNRIVAVIHLDH